MSSVRENQGREDPLHPAPSSAPAREDDIRRTREELAETVSELAARFNEFPGRARQAVQRGLTRPTTVAIVALLAATVVLWRMRHRL